MGEHANKGGFKLFFFCQWWLVGSMQVMHCYSPLRGSSLSENMLVLVPVLVRALVVARKWVGPGARP